MKITTFRIRASYPNYFMVTRYANEGRDIFNRDIDDKENTLMGNKPGTVLYRLEGDSPDGDMREFPPRWYDMYYLLKHRDREQLDYLTWLLMESIGPTGVQSGLFSATEYVQAVEHLESERQSFHRECRDYVGSNPLIENEYLITSLSEGKYTDNEISHKGRILLDLTHESFPVPDFCIFTAAAFNRGAQPQLLEDAIHNLEIMTHYKLGDSRNPLVFAIRCAMPQYIPGLMPTLLNIGVTRQAYEALRINHEDAMANRVYLSTLHTICEMAGIEKKYEHNDIELGNELQFQRIAQMEADIRQARPDGDRLLNDAHYQALKLVDHVRRFYLDNQDLILTFMQGKQAHPSLIIQRMVWTIGNDESYPGVLYSRHSRGGKGRQIESYRNIFGEEIMTGDVTSEDTAYTNRRQIRDLYPAVFHFDPLLPFIERRYKFPVTIEFAVESRPHAVSLFSMLQLNASEMTGRAALVSAIDMLNEGIIDEATVVDLIKPYHLRQIVSASIDDKSLSQLRFFGNGLSVLPRTALSPVLCFSISKAREIKAQGHTVCLCQERFVPEDTITLNEVDAIFSMTPAAIHVVTACRGYGIPAFMDLHSYGIHAEHTPDGQHLLVNAEGLQVREGERITISSKRQSLYLGVADFKPARFTKYLHNQPVKLSDEEKTFFREMKTAYERYQEIITSEEATLVGDIDKLARLIRCELQDQPDTAKGIVNNWYDANQDLCTKQVLASKMGSHQDLSRVFDLLTANRKVDFFRRVANTCIADRLSGLRAGSFMLGRFVARPLPTVIWNNLSDTIVAFLMNEYVLYEKYLYVLEEVGEIKLTRAHSRIETEGVDNMTIHNFDILNFVPLLYSTHDWKHVADELERIDHQDNTHILIEKLSQPKEELLGLDKSWKAAEVEDLLRKVNGI